MNLAFIKQADGTEIVGELKSIDEKKIVITYPGRIEMRMAGLETLKMIVTIAPWTSSPSLMRESFEFKRDGLALCLTQCPTEYISGFNKMKEAMETSITYSGSDILDLYDDDDDDDDDDDSSSGSDSGSRYKI